MASSSETPPPCSSAPIQDLDYFYASITNASNFVSVKLSSERNYCLWKTQMLCLMKSHNMVGLVDAKFEGPRASSNNIMDQYDSLLKGWIFSSVSENVLGAVVDLISAKDVWDRLNSFYDATINPEQDAVIVETKTTIIRPMVDIEANDNDKETKTEGLQMLDPEKLHKATVKGDWSDAELILQKNKDLVREAINNDGSTILHIAVGIGHNDFVKKLFSYMKDDDTYILEGRSSDGSTALHIAAIVGNTEAVDLLVEKSKALLHIKDHKGKEPLHKAYENMHLDTIGNLFKRNDDVGKTRALYPGFEIGVDLLVNAISAEKYSLALDLLQQFPNLSVKNDAVLMAIAKTKFPSSLDHGERFINPSLKAILAMICIIGVIILFAFSVIPYTFYVYLLGPDESLTLALTLAANLLLVPLSPLVIIFGSISLVILVVSYIFLMLYYLCWKAASMIVASFSHIQAKKKEGEALERVLQFVCDEIDKLKPSGAHHPYYTGPILEAARRNAYKVVDEILFRSPEAIQCKDKSGYDIIQLAVLHRSDKIYNFIYEIGERKNLYRTVVDSSKNNILHLAGKLAPSHELSRRTGAALQLQWELRWYEEVKKLVFPTYITQENNFKETPNMLFTREHTDLLKDGEKWMKTTAESCSITAALITTIVFAAAITVPGGMNEEARSPLFRHNHAFTIFAISDAISLFTSSTAVLVFLSILTARFAEKDFLVSLPRRLFIGLCALFISTTAMMVAFSASLFLVLCHEKTWMLGPICGLALIPILSFVTLQFPLIVDLFRSTFVSIFGKKTESSYRKFNPDNIRLFFGKRN